MASPKKTSTRGGFRRPQGPRAVFGTFNVKNLILPGHQLYGRPGPNKIEYGKKTKWLAHQLDEMMAGVVGFQEIWHEKALNKVISLSTMKGATIVAPGERANGPIVALASTFPVRGFTSYENLPESAVVTLEEGKLPISKFSRPVLNVQIEVKDPASEFVTEFDTWVVHLKSKRPSYNSGEDENDLRHLSRATIRSLGYRAVESLGVRHLILTKMEENAKKEAEDGIRRPTVLLGDLNDGYSSVTTNVIIGPEPWQYAPFETKKLMWQFLLRDAVEMLESRQKGVSGGNHTHIFNSHYERLDAILASDHFNWANPRKIGRVSEVRVYNDHLRDAKFATHDFQRWESDHGQITAEFLLDAPATEKPEKSTKT